MNIRPYTPEDLTRILQLHKESKLDYVFPDPDEFFSKQIVEADGIAMASFMRLTAEAYLVCDREWRNPAWKVEAFRQLCEVCRKDAKEQGVKEVGAFLPPGMERTFGNRLVKLGWDSTRSGWKYFWRSV